MRHQRKLTRQREKACLQRAQSVAGARERPLRETVAETSAMCWGAHDERGDENKHLHAVRVQGMRHPSPFPHSPFIQTVRRATTSFGRTAHNVCGGRYRSNGTQHGTVTEPRFPCRNTQHHTDACGADLTPGQSRCCTSTLRHGLSDLLQSCDWSARRTAQRGTRSLATRAKELDAAAHAIHLPTPHPHTRSVPHWSCPTFF